MSENVIEAATEVLEAQRFDTGRKTILAPIGERTPINEEIGIEPKYWFRGRVVVNSQGTKERIVKLVEKDASQMGLMADDFHEKWRSLKDIGMPVVPTVRRLDDRRVLMTDLTADGSGVYGKGKYIELGQEIDAGKKKEVSELDKKFMDIDLDDVEKTAQRLADKAAEQKVQLPLDDPFELVVHPDGSWNLVILDVRQSSKEPDWLTNRIRNLNQASVRAILMGSLWEIRNKLERVREGRTVRKIKFGP